MNRESLDYELLDRVSLTSTTPPLGLPAFEEVWISERLDYKLEENDSDLE